MKAFQDRYYDAVGKYCGLLRGRKLRWDKTEHHFPDVLPSE